MDIFDIHNVKVEKANAMLRYRRFRKITNVFRLVELFLAVVLFSWISTRLPFVVRIFGEYFRQLLSIIVSPLFIFLVGNVIVLTLFVKSGQLTGTPSAVGNAGTDLYEEIVYTVGEGVPSVLEQEEIIFQDKQIISEESSKPITGYGHKENEIKASQVTKEPVADSVPDLDRKIYRRSQSENPMKRERVQESDKHNAKLKRSETEIGRRKADTPEAVDNIVDELSNEEFQRRIEGFIARQVKFHQLEEKLAIVVPHN